MKIYLVECIAALKARLKRLITEQNLGDIIGSADTWKEATWNGYFKPKSLISRWETAFMIMKSLKNWNKNNITLK